MWLRGSEVRILSRPPVFIPWLGSSRIDRAEPILVCMLGAPILVLTLGVLVALTTLLGVETVLRVSRKIRGLEGELSHAQTEARFRALVQHSSDMIAIVERDATVRYASPAVTQILRRDALGLVGTSLLDLLEPHEVQ